jgi:hypothetical protein
MLKKTHSAMISVPAGNTTPIRSSLTKPRKSLKTTRTIDGHAMAIRDLRRTKTGKYAKLNDHGK